MHNADVQESFMRGYYVLWCCVDSRWNRSKAVLAPPLLWHRQKFTSLEVVEGSHFSGNYSWKWDLNSVKKRGSSLRYIYRVSSDKKKTAKMLIFRFLTVKCVGGAEQDWSYLAFYWSGLEIKMTTKSNFIFSYNSPEYSTVRHKYKSVVEDFAFSMNGKKIRPNKRLTMPDRNFSIASSLWGQL